jgi:squalene-hopene/tetraprenyl-beta-curcumene cyclase
MKSTLSLLTAGRFLLLATCAAFTLAVLPASAFAGHPGKGEEEDPYNLLPPPGATRDTAGEQFLRAFSTTKAGEYLDLRSHNIEKGCYACHSSGAYMAARPLIDPLAEGVMETRVLMQRFAADFTAKPPLDRTKSGAVERAQRILTAVEMARHDAVSTGKLQPMTRKALDHLWAFQLDDGSFAWVPFKEAPSAIDHHWGVTLVALGAAAAPGGYAQTEPAKSGIEKLRAWFKAHAPKDLHERGLTVIADWAVGGILTKEQRDEHIAAFFAKQLPTHGWSTGTLSVHPDWKRPDGQPLDITRTDGYATGFAVYVLTRAGVPPSDARLAKALDWLRTNQRETGGYYTFSPRKKDILASYTGTSFAIQALSATGVLPLPKRVTQEQFDAAYAKADKLIAADVMKPNSTGKQARDAKMTMEAAKPATPVSAKAPSASADKVYPDTKPAAAITNPKQLAAKIVSSHGGADKLLRTFKFTELYLLAGKDKGTERTSTLQPPNLWYVGKTERVSEQNKGGVCHDVWMWTLTPLVDPKTKLESLPDANIEGKAAHALKVSGSIEPPMNVFFDATTDDLLKIECKGEQFFFSAPMEVDGTRVPSKCVLIGKTGKERMRTELKKTKRLPTLPADLPKPDGAKP